MLFGKKKPEGRTLLILDVENGSVGGALVRLADDAAPKLFGETRINTKLLPTRDSISLLHHVGQSIDQTLSAVSEVASRLRNAPAAPEVQDIGNVSSAVVFLGAPWGTPNLGADTPTFIEPMVDRAWDAVAATFGKVPQSFHTAAGAAFAGSRHMLPQDDPYLLCIVSAEITEIVLIEGEVAVGYATVPRGRRAVVRTLRAHATISDHEALSALRLGGSVYAEPLDVASREYADDIAEAVANLLKQSPLGVSHIYVVAHGAMGKGESEWFAQSLAANTRMGSLLPQGSVRSLGSHHAMPYLSAHAEEPDLMLMLQTIFVGSHL